jgi:hypothetical protein
MSFFSSVFHWAQNSGVLAQAQQVAAAEAAKAIQAALATASGHAPDMKPQLEQDAAAMLKTVMFGLSTQAK